jgi:hypothetical protein
MFQGAKEVNRGLSRKNRGGSSDSNGRASTKGRGSFPVDRPGSFMAAVWER